MHLRFLIPLLVLTTSANGVAKAGIIMTESFDVTATDGMQGASVTFKATIPDGALWQNTFPGFLQADLPDATVTISGAAATGLNGAYTPTAAVAHWSRTTGNDHWSSLAAGNIAEWTNGTNNIKFSTRTNTVPQDATVGSLVLLDDIQGHWVSSPPGLVFLQYISGPDNFEFRNLDDISNHSNSANSAAVPEPSTYAVLGLCTIGLIGYRRRKRKHAA